jgi:hypothetical protein
VARADAAMLPSRVVREATFDPLSQQPEIVRNLFDAIHSAWVRHYRDEVRIVAGLMCAAWLTAIVALLRFAILRRPRSFPSVESETRKVFVFADGLVASIIIASLLFGYNAAITSVFAEPDFRYRQMADLQAILVGGLGLISIQHWIRVTLSGGFAMHVSKRWNEVTRSMWALDEWQRLTALQLALLVIGVAFASFGWWTLFMLTNTPA